MRAITIILVICGLAASPNFAGTASGTTELSASEKCRAALDRADLLRSHGGEGALRESRASVVTCKDVKETGLRARAAVEASRSLGSPANVVRFLEEEVRELSGEVAPRSSTLIPVFDELVMASARKGCDTERATHWAQESFAARANRFAEGTAPWIGVLRVRSSHRFMIGHCFVEAGEPLKGEAMYRAAEQGLREALLIQERIGFDKDGRLEVLEDLVATLSVMGRALEEPLLTEYDSLMERLVASN